MIEWLHSMEIYDYDIYDGIIHVVGDVDLYNKRLICIPVQFGYVSGNFNCGWNRLTSLEGCPSEVGGAFYCGDNQLKSLEGCPSEVGGNFKCHDNQLTSLEGCPSEVGDDFLCSFNYLKSLEGGPTEVGGGFYCSDNNFTVEPDHSGIKIGGKFLWK
jgi:hypothetical protein